MVEIAFLVLAVGTVVAAILAIEARELVYGAVSLGATFLGVAGLFILLDAQYVAAFQIAVYIGAVVVLILFTVMLVGSEKPTKGEPGGPLQLRRFSVMAAVLVAMTVAVTGGIATASLTTQPGPYNFSVQDVAKGLLDNYGLALPLLALVLSAALMGALTLAKREEK